MLHHVDAEHEREDEDSDAARHDDQRDRFGAEAAARTGAARRRRVVLLCDTANK